MTGKSRFITFFSRWLTIILPLAWLPFAATGQSSQDFSPWDLHATPYFRHLISPRDLPSAASAITQDKTGMIWIGTQDGLVRWDGYRPRIFRHDPQNPASLPANLITGLTVDNSDNLYVATASGAVAQYDPVREEFISFPNATTGIGIYSAFTVDDVGQLWIGNSNGLSFFDRSSKRWKMVDLPFGSKVWSLLLNRDGSLWVGTDQGLLQRPHGTNQFQRVGPSVGEAGSTRLTNIRALYQSTSGDIWFGTNDGTVGVLNGDGAVRFADPIKPASAIHGLGEIRPGVISVATAGAGISLIDENSGKLIQSLRFDPGRPTGIGEDSLYGEFVDPSGGLWISHQYGADYLPPGNSAFLSLLPSDRDKSAFSGTGVSGLMPQPDGSAWIGTERGADLINPFTGLVESTQSQKDGGKLPATLVYAFATAGHDQTWIATGQGLFEKVKDEVRRFPPLADNPVRSLLVEGDILWIGTERRGLVRYNLVDHSLISFVHDSEDPKSISDNWIYSIARDPNRGLWVATAHGLNLFDGNKFEHFLHIQNDPDSLPVETPLSLLLDHLGRLWVGTQGGGVALLDGQNSANIKFRHLGRAQGLMSDNVGLLIEDRQGQIWGSTDAGLTRIDPQTFSAKSYSSGDGVAIPAFYSGSGGRASDGTLLFGGVGGIAIVHPERLVEQDTRPKVVPIAVRIEGRVTSALHPLILPPSDHSLQVEFAALDYAAPERVHYAYRLLGFDKDWIYSDADHRIAAYTNLPPGTYKLLIKAYSHKELWTDPPTELRVTVLPAWYQTAWFKALIFLMILGAIAIFVRSRTALLRRRQKELETQIGERTAEIASLLHNSGEGFLSFGPDLVIDRQYSRACETFLGEAPAGKNAAALLFAENPRHATFVSESVPAALTAQDSHKRDLILSLLPKEFDRRGRRLKTHYSILENNHLMVVLRDISTERRLSERIASEHRRLEMIVAAVTDSRDFFDAVGSFQLFVDSELEELLGSESNHDGALKELYRAVHTFKGVFNQFSFEKTPAALHQLEEELDALKQAPSSIQSEISAEIISKTLFDALERDLSVLRQALGDDFLRRGGQVTMTPLQASRFKKFVAQWRSGETMDLNHPEIRELIDDVSRLGTISLVAELAGYDQTIAQVARRMEKEVTPLAISGGEDIWLDPDLYGPFLRSLIHVFRNSIAHGIETPDVRLDKGKPEHGSVSCNITVLGNMIELVIADDGAGVDIEALRRQVVKAGHLSREEAERHTDQDILNYVFQDSITTSAAASDWSGRGVGLAAVRHEVEALGGKVAIETEPDTGTRFIFTIRFIHHLISENI